MAKHHSTTQMASVYPTLHSDAVRFRVARLLDGEEEAHSELSPARAALVAQWHLLQALEGQGPRTA